MSRTVRLDSFLQGKRSHSEVLRVPIVDLYCGVGGFSTGAAMAGHTVALAVDAWHEAVAWHSHNHPTADHYIFTLPDERLLAQLPPPDTLWHLHGSPPCQVLSKAQGSEKTKSRWDEGLENIRYFLNLALERRPASWSMEEVANGVVLRLLQEYRDVHPYWIDFEVVDMSFWGVPQTRRRVIAGSPFLIQRLRDVRQPLQRVGMRQACKTMPKNAIGIKGQRGHWGNHGRGAGRPAFKKCSIVVPLERRVRPGGTAVPSPTVLCSNCLTWAKSGGETIRCLTLREHADLQTFPHNYIFPEYNRVLSQRLCGNAVPPKFAQVLMADYRLPTPLPPSPAVFPPRPPSPCAVD